MEEDELKKSIEHLSKLLDQKEQDKQIFNEKQINSLMVLVEIHDRNPKALDAWVWLYDTAFRFRSIGNFLIGVMKWLLLLGGTFILFKEHSISLIKTAIDNFISLFGG